MDFLQGKFRDQGSNFSHETRFYEAAGDLADKGNFFFLNFINDDKKIFSKLLTKGDKRIIVSCTSS